MTPQVPLRRLFDWPPLRFRLGLRADQEESLEYSCSKAIDEFLALAYHKAKHLPIVIVRLFNTVGRCKPGSTAWSCGASFSRLVLASR
jgi:nucleoside-diphosphate-sugar epimerase